MRGPAPWAIAAAAASVALAMTPPGAASAGELVRLEARVGQSPEDTDAHYALARAYLASGRYAEAADEFDMLLVLDPANADWLLGRAQAALALDRAAEALTLLRRARALAPAYEDLWHSEAIALEVAGSDAAAEALLAAAAERFPSAEWPAARRRKLRAAHLARSGMRLGASASYEDLSDGLASWQSGTVRFEAPFGAFSRVAVGAALERRYDEQEGQLAIGYVRRLPRDWVIEASGELAPDAQLLPETRLQLEISRRLTDSVSASLRYGHATYATADVDALAAVTEYYSGNYRAAYVLTATRPDDVDARFAHALRLARDYGLGSSVTLALARGEEAETVATGQVLVTRNTSVALFGTHWRSAAWAVTWSCGWVQQGDLYERLGVRLGFEHRF